MDFKVRLMRTVSFESDVVVQAANEQDAKRQALEKARFIIWEHRNSAEYEVLTIKNKSNPDEEETSTELKNPH
jgi:hypothetical protein